jgi:hypothetical protein
MEMIYKAEKQKQINKIPVKKVCVEPDNQNPKFKVQKEQEVTHSYSSLFNDLNNEETLTDVGIKFKPPFFKLR